MTKRTARMTGLTVTLAGAITAGLLVWLPAAAQASCPDPYGPWNTIGSPIGTAWLGVRVSNPGMAIYDGTPTCGRVSSLFVTNSSGTRYVEVGWYEDPQGTYNCIPKTTGAPRALAFSYNNGIRGCKTTGPDLAEGNQSFYIQDPNTDGVWQFFRAGTQIWQSPDLTPFSSGIVMSNGERQTYDYTPAATFNGLQRMASSGSWGNWHSTQKLGPPSDDLGAHFCWYSDTYTAVKLSETAC